MLKGIDISHHESVFPIAEARIGFCIMKATEGETYNDPCFKSFAEECESNSIPFGFFDYAQPGVNAAVEAKHFRNVTKDYELKGIPILDVEEDGLDNAWIDKFVRTYHALSGVFPWIYMNSDFVNNKKLGSNYVKSNCGLWLAGYPKKYTSWPQFDKCPYKHEGWTLACWQFTDSLKLGGFSVDGDLFYGDGDDWTNYANPNRVNTSSTVDGNKWELARRTINGEFGNGAQRQTTLGDKYDEVQACVNSLLLDSDNALAHRVINGELGNGDTRKFILGTRYKAVQTVVNKLLK